MEKTNDKEMRFFMDVELKSMKILKLDHDLREALNMGKPPSADVYRVFLTQGQYNKFVAALPE